MGTLNDLLGKKYGTLLVVSKEKTDSHGHARWKVVCEKCKKKYVIVGNNLTSGEIKNCKFCNRNKKYIYTAEMLGEMMKLKENGLTYREIAKLYNTSTSGVYRNIKMVINNERTI